MSQGQGGRGGTGHTLLYYIGLEGKEYRRTKEQKQVERERKTEGQKNRKKINGPENGRAKEQEKGGTRTGKKP